MKKFSFLEKLPRIVFTGKVQKEVQLEKSLTMKLPTDLAIFEKTKLQISPFKRNWIKFCYRTKKAHL